MGLFPCLRFGSRRWWLPLSDRCVSLVGRILISGDDRSDLLVRDCARALHEEPTFFLFAAFHWPTGDACEEDLLQWMLDHLGGRFAEGDAFLGAPKVTPEHQQQFKKLRAHFSTTHRSEWMRDAALWLEVLGPQVPSTWRDKWPNLELEAESWQDDDPSTDSHSLFLQQLARQSKHHRVLDQNFRSILHRNKLGSLKQLAYGLSHEINNPLANISTRAQQLQRGESDPDRHATLERIVGQVYRAHEMISDLMFYANPPKPTIQTCDLNELLTQLAGDFDQFEETRSIRTEFQLPATPAEVDADRDMIRQAVGALIRNAAEAIGHGGTIVVSLVEERDPVTDDGKRLRRSGELGLRSPVSTLEKEGGVSGNAAVTWSIHVADSGPGLTDSDRAHAFDPYYSGREAGRGLGLGLCRAYRIVKLHGGDIRLTGGPAGCVATITLGTNV